GLAQHESDVPAGLALSANGARLYVVLNLSNRLLEMDVESGKTLRLFGVGVAPYEVVLAREKAYVSNWGGRRPDEQSQVGPAGHGTTVRVDPVRAIASEGTVSVVDLKSGQMKNEIQTGLHTAPMALSRDGRHLAIAVAGS